MERYRECDSNVVLHHFIVWHIVPAQICKVEQKYRECDSKAAILMVHTQDTHCSISFEG